MRGIRNPVAPAELAPGKSLTIRATLSGAYYRFRLLNPDRDRLVPALDPGRYRVRIEVAWDLPPAADAKRPFWSGKRTTNPADFAIADPAKAKPAVERAILRMEERHFKLGEGKLISPKKNSDPGYGVEGGNIVSQLHIDADGSFTYDGVSGKMPKEEVLALVDQIAKMSDGLTAAAMSRSVQFFFRDNGTERSRLRTFPAPAGEEANILRKLGELKKKYGK
jgi:hypothetical protein